jgi:hypothetical protein
MDDPMEQYRNYASPDVGPYGASLIQIDSNKAMYLAIAIMAIAITFAALAFGFAMNAKDQAMNTEARTRGDLARVESLILREQQRIDRETRLQRLETDELKAAFMNAGFKTHLETDAP